MIDVADKVAKLIPYEYSVWGKTKRVWVDKDNAHPDPSKMLIWGWDDCGELVPGDFKGQFTRDGKAVDVRYSIQGTHTASAEKGRKIEAIERYIKTIGACKRKE